MRHTTLALVFVVTVFAIFLAAQQGVNRSKHQSTKVASPLILQEGEGDHLIHRAGPLGGVPFTIKVDSQFGNAEDFFVFSETLAPGQVIPFHMHHNAEELLLFEEEGARVIVGAKAGDAGAHSLIFIPRNTWISATNTSKNPVRLLAIFSRAGFEQYMRAISSRPGEPLKPLDQKELTRLRALGHSTYWDTSKGPYPPGVAHP